MLLNRSYLFHTLCWSCLPLYVFAAAIYLTSRIIVFKNESRRSAILKQLAISELQAKRKFIIGFFHPYCNAGGGGERVLWTAIAHIQRTQSDTICAVYTGDTDATKDDIINKVKARFNIILDPSSLHFVFLSSRILVEDKTWPAFTLLGQSLGSMYLVFEGLTQLIPDLYIDTMGYAFTFPLTRLLAPYTKVGGYVHYPTISTSMLSRVRTRTANYSNSSAISKSRMLSFVKLLYYRVFHYLYAVSLRKASFIMVNSSWTRSHVSSSLSYRSWLLGLCLRLLTLVCPPLLLFFLPRDGAEWKTGASNPVTVYPPCDTEDLESFSLVEGTEEGKKQNIVLSVAQFRPEKAHTIQLHALALLFAQHPEYRHSTSGNPVRLVLVGGSRNKGDEARVDALHALAKQLGIEENVQIITNAPYSQVLAWLARSNVGINTMDEEHFGINVVEYMAAGLIPLVHASGGPLLDIVVPRPPEQENATLSDAQLWRTGYHATDASSFAEALNEIFSLTETERHDIRARARSWAVIAFSERAFVEGWDNAVGKFVRLAKTE